MIHQDNHNGDKEMARDEHLSQLFMAYYNRLLQYGLLIVPQKEMVEDTLQELFLWLFTHPEKVSDIQQLDVYLFQSVKRNLWKKFSKQRKNQKNVQDFVSDLSVEKVAQAHEKAMIHLEDKRMQSELLQEELSQLPSQMKEVLYLKYYEGLNFEEIATVMNVSNQVARNYAHRAIKRLRKHLTGKEQLIFAFSTIFAQFA